MNRDHIFDGIASKFANNIYGTTKGKLRQLILCDVLEPHLGQPIQVLEVGGGTGVMTAHLAAKGHRVVLTDASADVLALARENLSGLDNVEIRQQYLAAIDDISNYDLIVCHAVLEWLSDPHSALEFLYQNMRSGAKLSLSFFNKDAALFANAIYGNFDYIARGMKVKNQVRLNPKQPLSAKEITEYCQSLGFNVLSKTGIRCFHDYLKDKSQQTTHFESLLALERKYNQKEPFMWLGKYFHLLLQK